MTTTAAPGSRLASLLADARRALTLIEDLPADIEPRSIMDGYRAQDAFRAIWPQRVAGWKVGATALPVQQKFGIGEPFCGPFFAPDVSASPAILPAARFPHRLLECEIAIRFGKAIEPRKEPIDRRALLAAIDAVIPAFEIVSPRFPTLLFGRAPLAVADCGLNAAIVLGNPFTSWRDLDLASLKVILYVEGVAKGEGSGAHVLGSPLNVLDWLVAHLASRDIVLEAGSIVLTGTTTGVVPVPLDQVAVADFGPLGTIELKFFGPAHPDSARVAMG